MWDQWLEAALEKTSESSGNVRSILYGLEWWRWLLIALGICTLTAGVFILIRSSQTSVIVPPSSATVATASAQLASISRKMIYVDVAGAVVHPDLYELPEGSRAGAAIVAAGGLTPQANQVYLRKSFNSASALQDGQKLYIPFAGEELADTAGEKATTSTESKATSTTGAISINTASSDALDALPGIGAVRVEQIIAGRPYTRLEELTEKQILTTSVYAGLAGLITL